MTTSFNLTADGVAKQALQKCGVVGLGRDPDPTMLQDARDTLSVILKTLQARGTTLTQLQPLTLNLVAGQASYVLPANIISVEDEVATLLQVSGSTANSETYVQKISYQDYRIISDKTTQGPPTRFYVEMLSTLTAFFWSVPDQPYVFNFRGLALLPDISDGTTQPGLTQRWMAALVWRLAYWLSFPLNVPAARRAELKTEADLQEAIVLGQESERVDMNLMLPPDPFGSYT